MMEIKNGKKLKETEFLVKSHVEARSFCHV
jgi:hypothetical protein